MSQVLPYDEIEMWHGNSDLSLNNLEETLNTPDDSGIGYFIEVGLKYPDNIKEQTKFFSFVLKKKLFMKLNKVIV